MLIDAHTHTHLRSAEDLDAMAGAGIEGVVVCAFLPVRPTGAATLIDLFHWLTEEECVRLAEHGLAGRAAVGVHPRCIPATGLEAAIDRVAALLASGTAAALGEVGLETGCGEERDVLAAQLELARRLRTPVILHTPRKRKEELLAVSLELVAAARLDPVLLVIDHLSAELADKALGIGACAGLTVQPGKLDPAGVVAAVRRHGTERLLVNSDIAHVAADPRAVAVTRQALARAGIPVVGADAVTGGNAARLFGF